MPVPLSRIQAFYQAYARRDVAALMEFIADDIDWQFLGPVDVFPFCGHRRGKAAVIDHFTRLIPTRFSVRRLQPEELVVDGDRAASFSKITSVENGTGRILTYHCAHFVTFRDGKVAIMRAVADSFGVLEQMSDVEIVVGDVESRRAQAAALSAAQEPLPDRGDFDGAMPDFLRGFYQAYVTGERALLERILDDNVTWLISGPADHVDFFGLRRGKAEVIELITRIIPCYERIAKFDIEHLLVQGERAASFGRVCAHQRETARSLRFAYAHFLHFRDGKLVALRGLADSFDAVSQIMGCRVVAAGGTALVPELPDGDLAVV